MNRREFLAASGLAAAALWVPPLRAMEAGEPLREFGYGDVTLGPGLARSQFEDTLAVVLGANEDSLLKPYRQRAGLAAPGPDMGGWYTYVADYDYRKPSPNPGFAPGHCLGQWISALARSYAATGSQAMLAKMQRLLRGYAAALSPRFFADFRWPSYTYDKLVCAVIDAHQFAGEPLALLDELTMAAMPALPERALDHNEMKGPDESWCWDESYTLAENLFLAYQRGAGPRYRDLGRRFLKDDTYFNPLSEGRNALPGHHAYSYTNALSSAMQAYLTLGSAKHLRAAVNAFDFLSSTQSFATGGWGPDETFREPGKGELAGSLTGTHNSFETPCGGYAHFKLTRDLLRVTREARYGDSMERVLYNCLLGVKPLQPDGRTFYYSDYNFAGRKVYHPDPWPCCCGTLPQVAADYHISTYFRDPDGVWVNLYLPSTVRWGPATLTQSGDYPSGSQVEFTVATERDVEFRLRLRIPGWADGAAVAVNGRSVAGVTPGRFAGLRRTWRNGDRVQLELPLRVRLEAVDLEHPEIVAVVRGPLVLFALGEGTVTRRQLLAVETAAEGFRAGGLKLLPWTAIGEERYSTYLRVG